jgi:hypothetical protein
METTTESRYVCPRCGSDDVEGAFWANLNTGEIGETCEAVDIDFCNKCNASCIAVEREMQVPVEQPIEYNSDLEERFGNIKKGLLDKVRGVTLIPGALIDNYMKDVYDGKVKEEIHNYIISLPKAYVRFDQPEYMMAHITGFGGYENVLLYNGLSKQIFAIPSNSPDLILEVEELAKFLTLKPFDYEHLKRKT